MKQLILNFNESIPDKPETYPPIGYVMTYSVKEVGFGFSTDGIVLAEVSEEDIEVSEGEWITSRYLVVHSPGFSGDAYLNEAHCYWCTTEDWNKALCNLTGEVYNSEDFHII